MNNVPFAYACKHRLIKIITSYLEWNISGAHVKWRARMEKSDLMFDAIRKGYTDVVQVFVDFDFDLRTKNNLALHLACIYGHFDIVEFIIDQLMGWTNIYTFHYNVIDFVSSKNNLAMRIAFSFGYMDIVNFLYHEMQCKLDRFCMEVARMQQDKDKMQFIIDFGGVEILEPHIIKTEISHYYQMKSKLNDVSDLFFQSINKDDFIFYTCGINDCETIKLLLNNYMM